MCMLNVVNWLFRFAVGIIKVVRLYLQVQNQLNLFYPIPLQNYISVYKEANMYQSQNVENIQWC